MSYKDVLRISLLLFRHGWAHFAPALLHARYNDPFVQQVYPCKCLNSRCFKKPNNQSIDFSQYNFYNIKRPRIQTFISNKFHFIFNDALNNARHKNPVLMSHKTKHLNK